MCYWCEERKSCLSCGKPLEQPKNGDFSGTLNSLVGGISVLQEAVEKLLASDPQIAGTTDEELEEAVQNGYDPQIRIQAEAILIARNALRMTGSLNPSNGNNEGRIAPKGE